jgi:long-chain acyl-CoA synthetase
MSYTSGTTGRPKGVRRFIDGERPFAEMFAGLAGMNDVILLPTHGLHLNVSALFHGAPLAFSLSQMSAGVTLRVIERFDATRVLDELQRGVTSTIMVPTMFRQLLNLPADVRARFSAPDLEVVLHGGEPCPRPLKQAMIDWWGPIFVEYYGMTEGGMTIASCQDWLERPGTVGRATRNIPILILDPDGRRLPPGEAGTIYFQPPGGQFFEYHHSPEKTAAAHTPDGSAFTVGDIGFLDDDGYLYISGRTADVIVSSGVNVYPAEIENVLAALPELRDAGVAAGPDDLRGETPVAFVVPQPGLSDDDVVAAVTAACEARLASYQRPRQVIVRPSVPRDPTGKLLRHVLRAELWEGRESNFAAPPGGPGPGEPASRP